MAAFGPEAEAPVKRRIRPESGPLARFQSI